MKRFLLSAVAMALLGATADADLWDDLAQYKMGDGGDQPVPAQVEELIAKTPLDRRGPIEDALIKLVDSPAATPDAKGFACRMLQRVGTEKCVPTLARLLADERLSHFARLALERMTESAKAGQALRDALDRASDTLKPGLLGSIGERRDEAAIAKVSALVSSPDPVIGKAALLALGKIGGKRGKQALESVKVSDHLKPAWFDALLLCAEGLKDAQMFQKIYSESSEDRYRAAALVGLVAADERSGSALVVDTLKGEDSYLRRTALRCVAVEPSPELTKAVCGMLGELNPIKQTELVSLLGERGDRSALASVSKFLASDVPQLREAAIAAVGLLGDANSVPPLLTQANDQAYNQKAIESIASMTDPGVDKALMAALQNDRLTAPAIQAIARRYVAEAVPQLTRLTADNNSEVRQAAWTGLGAVASSSNLAEMMKRMLAAQDDAEKTAAQKALEKVCARAEDKNACLEAIGAYYSNPDESVKSFILDVAGAAGGPKALDIARAGLKSGSQALYRKSVQTLASWPSDAAAPDLLELAASAPDETIRIVSLQGYIKLADKIGDHRKRMAALDAGQKLIRRVDEKRMLIMALGKTQRPDALARLVAYLDEAEVRKEAQLALVDLGQQLAKKNPAEVKLALEKVIGAAGVAPNVLKKAQDLHKQVSAQK